MQHICISLINKKIGILMAQAASCSPSTAIVLTSHLGSLYVVFMVDKTGSVTASKSPWFQFQKQFLQYYSDSPLQPVVLPLYLILCSKNSVP